MIGVFVQLGTGPLQGYVIDGDGCWLWAGSARKGYGVWWQYGRRYIAHRQTYEMLKGPIPMGLTLDHLCRNRRCVNPDHLEAISTGANVLRGEGPPARNRRKTHCVRGHPLKGSNLRTDRRGHRECVACRSYRGVRAHLPQVCCGKTFTNVRAWGGHHTSALHRALRNGT